MRKLIFISAMCCLIMACTDSANQALTKEIAELKELVKTLETENISSLKKGDIQHTVQFNLKWEAGSPESKKFINDGKRILSALPMVNNFEALRQVGSKNEYKYYFTMIFVDQKAYDEYNNHPEHVKFVKERWDSEVTDFLEADFMIFD